MTPFKGYDDTLLEVVTFTVHLSSKHCPRWIILIGSSEACAYSLPSLPHWIDDGKNDGKI